MPRVPPKMQKVIVDALLEAFDSNDMVELLIEVNQEYHLFDSSGATPEQRARLVVSKASEDDWLRDLLDAACRLRPRSTSFPRLRDQLIVLNGRRAPPDFDLTRLCRLNGGVAFIDRANLRIALGSLKAGQGKSILVVKDGGGLARGGALTSTRSGKSASWKLIAELGHRTGHFYPVLIDLHETQEGLGVNDKVDPKLLAERLIDKLDYEAELVPPEPKDMQWSRWNMRFIDRLEPTLRNDQRNIWLVIDEFNKVSLPEASKDLVKGLAKKVTKGEVPNLRLVLLGFDDALPAEAGQRMLIDEVQPKLAASDLFDFFRTGWEQHGLAADAAALEKFEKAATEMFNGLQCSQLEFLETIGAKASAALIGLIDEGGGNQPGGEP